MSYECTKMVEIRGTYQKWIRIKIIVLSLLSSISRGQTPTLFLSPNVVEIGQNFTVTCQVEINNDIYFFVNNTKKGECPSPGLGDPCQPQNIEQDIAAKVTTWTLTAAEEYDGNWTCRRLGGFDAPSMSMSMYKCPDSVISETGIDSNLLLNGSATVRITVIIGCIYPTINPDFKLRFLSPQSSTEKALNCKTTSSPCITGSAYECIHTISAESDLEKETNYTLHIESVVLQSVGSCPRLAIFEPYSVRFEKIGGTTPDSPTCDCTLIYVVHFIWTLLIVVLTFFAVIFIALKRPDFGEGCQKVQIFVAVFIDFVLECSMLWGIEYGFDFQTFRTNDACNVAIIGAVCHVVILVILVVKIVVLIRFTEQIQELMASCCVTQDTMEPSVKSGPLTNRSNDSATRNGVEQSMPPRTHNITQSVTTRT